MVGAVARGERSRNGHHGEVPRMSEVQEHPQSIGNVVWQAHVEYLGTQG